MSINLPCQNHPPISTIYMEPVENVTGKLQWAWIMQNTCTVKLVYKDHPRDPQNVVFIHRLSLYVGSETWKVYLCGPVKCDL